MTHAAVGNSDDAIPGGGGGHDSSSLYIIACIVKHTRTPSRGQSPLRQRRAMHVNRTRTLSVFFSETKYFWSCVYVLSIFCHRADSRSKYSWRFRSIFACMYVSGGCTHNTSTQSQKRSRGFVESYGIMDVRQLMSRTRKPKRLVRTMVRVRHTRAHIPTTLRTEKHTL